MQLEFAEELKDRLAPEKTGLQVGATYVPANQLLKDYLNRPYGNAYDFDQIASIEGVF
jgi:hypothetical protein